MPSDSAGVPPPTGPPSFDGSLAEPVPGMTRIGHYRIVRRLGAGGMGVVYLAEQDEPVHRQVALKVVRAGTDSDEIVARFASERQTLALMAHPNITSVYDAGVTESGLPYFVMEYVIGEPLSEYADTTGSASGNACACSPRSVTPFSMPIRRASSIATSSPRMSW